ncbi:MAG: translational GTPase TypA [Rhabdochlamydiaceae bacterium]|nr:translational GTPase TypA [Rhabdochlamydiaceae bacterium]
MSQPTFFKPEKIRNIAIIAHIDHGKTTLLDQMLKQSNVFRDNEKVPERVMDSYDQEQERGITIFAKHTSVFFEDYKINIIDTPGHADFSGEVERVLGLVNSVLLIVDAQEGPMPQTRFVLSQALKMGIRPIVVLNKIDRPHANPDRALNLTFDLFVELGATDAQLDFPIIYASGLQGFAMKNLGDPQVDLKPLFELIVSFVPAPPGNLELPFLMQSTTLTYDDYVGRQACGRVLEGKIKKGDMVARVNKEGHPTQHKIVRIEGYLGLKKVEMEEAGVGDIISLAGIPDVTIGDTICSPTQIIQLPPIHLAEPTLTIEVMVNNGPFVGRDGKNVTMNKIKDRLTQEKRANISLKIDMSREEAIEVSGRGELHLAVLMEAMRREGYEFVISKPRVIIKDIDGVKSEPMENVHIEIPQEYSGSVIEELSRRRGEMRFLETNEHGITTLQFYIPTRGLMGYRGEFLTSTRGLGILTSVFENYAPWKGEIVGRQKGVLISGNQGKTTGYASFALQDRGSLFVAPGDEVYEGMIVGENSRDSDMIVNVTKEKQLTNVRAAGSDENIILTPPRKFTLETAIDFINEDEFVEITPKNIRLRKRLMKENERKRSEKK